MLDRMIGGALGALLGVLAATPRHSCVDTCTGAIDCSIATASTGSFIAEETISQLGTCECNADRTKCLTNDCTVVRAVRPVIAGGSIRRTWPANGPCEQTGDTTAEPVNIVACGGSALFQWEIFTSTDCTGDPAATWTYLVQCSLSTCSSKSCATD